MKPADEEVIKRGRGKKRKIVESSASEASANEGHTADDEEIGHVTKVNSPPKKRPLQKVSDVN